MWYFHFFTFFSEKRLQVILLRRGNVRAHCVSLLYTIQYGGVILCCAVACPHPTSATPSPSQPLLQSYASSKIFYMGQQTEWLFLLPPPPPNRHDCAKSNQTNKPKKQNKTKQNKKKKQKKKNQTNKQTKQNKKLVLGQPVSHQISYWS